MDAMNRFSAGLGFLLICALSAAAQQPFILHGHRPPEIARARPSGYLAETNLPLTIGLPLRHTDELGALLARIYDPASPDYGHYLTPEEFTARFGPTQEQYDTAIRYAGAHGLQLTATHPNRLIFNATGAVADIEKVFHTRLRVYPHPTEPRTFFAPESEPAVDPAFPILDASGLDNFMPPRPMNLQRKPLDRTPARQANVTGSGPGGLFIGDDFRAAYAPGVTLDGFGQTVGLFEFGNYYPLDISSYEQRAGLQNINIVNVSVSGFNTTPAPGTDDGEEALDVQMAISMAPAATLMVYEGSDADSILNQIATDNKAKQIGCSFGWYPPDANLNSILLELSAQGQSLFVASGDGGAYTSSSTIFAPTDFTNITCVGGTSLTTGGRRGPWVSETGWIGSGGGVSTTFSIPKYQQGISMSANHGSTTMRNIPDVSALADTIIFTFNEDGSSGGIGGTSAATPLWAGFMALVNEQAAANGRPAIGSLNTALYNLGKSAAYTPAFHDITTGDDFNTDSPDNYSAVAGYDLCTGWGTPDGTNMLDALASAADSLRIAPGFGFSANTPWGVPISNQTTSFTVTNAGSTSISWGIGGGAAWLDTTNGGGALNPGQIATYSVTLDAAAVSNLVSGTYHANVRFTNLTTGVVQSRLFVLTISSAAAPIAFTGFNAAVIAPNTATSSQPQATAFDVANDYSFFETGLQGSSEGLATNGMFFSGWDGLTTFQFGPYGSNDVLMLGGSHANSGTLTLSNPKAYNSIAILASSANASASSVGTLVVHFTNGASSQTYNFNAQDWFNTASNAALSGFGRLQLNGFSLEDDGGSNPNFYQTIINLAAAGLNQPVSSITFTKPSSAGDTGVFAVSGALMPPAAAIGLQPQSVTNANPSAAASMVVYAMGASPLSYQWYSNGIAIAGANASNLVFNPAIPTNAAGSYFVVVSNSYGAVTSAVATLTVYRAPVIVQQPGSSSYTWFQGGGGTISVQAVGATPLTAAWCTNGVAVAGDTSTNLTFRNVQPDQSGVYTLVLSNSFGSVTSSPVTITVIPAYTPFPRDVLNFKPLGYWRLDETSGSVAHDFFHANNGTYNSVSLGKAGYDATFSPQTDPSEHAAQFGPGAQSYVSLPTVDVSVPNGSNGEFAIAAWVNASASISTDAGIFTKGYGGGDEEFDLDCGGGGHAFRFFVRDVKTGNAFAASSSRTPDAKWHYLVGVCDQAKSNIILYIDGASSATGTITAGTGIHTGTVPASIGSREGGSGQSYNFQFIGTIGDVAIFTNALTAAQVLGLYNALKSGPAILQQPAAWEGMIDGSATNDVVAAGASLSYQWYGPGGLISGANASDLTVTNLQPVAAGDYYVVVSNPYGTAQSSAAYLTVNSNVLSGGVTIQNAAGGQLQLSWASGVLQSAPAVQGPYADVTNVASPYTILPTNAQQFFRLRGQ